MALVRAPSATAPHDGEDAAAVASISAATRNDEAAATWLSFLTSPLCVSTGDDGTASDSNPPHRFSYSLLCSATNSFSTILGHGGFGPVFFASLAGKPLAVKLLDSFPSLQGDPEFYNELLFASRLLCSSSSSTCCHVVPAIGFTSDPKRRRFLIVYDLMHNGNLHDALLRQKSPELMRWQTRFSVALDVARGL
nr:receptor-like serine/threonine-protein kinase At4g25390 [Arachis hypogaea]